MSYVLVGPCLPRVLSCTFNHSFNLLLRFVPAICHVRSYSYVTPDTLLQCLVAFLEGPDTDLAMQSIQRLKTCADHLAKGDLHILPPVSQRRYVVLCAEALVVVARKAGWGLLIYCVHGDTPVCEICSRTYRRQRLGYIYT